MAPAELWPDLMSDLLDSVTDTDTLGIEFAYTLADGSITKTVSGSFEAAHTSRPLPGDKDLSTVQPSWFVKLANLPNGWGRGDVIERVIQPFAGKYEVVDIQADGQGGAKLILSVRT